ncbi:hypothetical protein KVT40_001376 [Elsinoe batatas]|uniref:Uncharacterized protein n=1 Tax=Elsinoe batatas TaxID=2601811 RepID=A0A8K0L6C0_9PEZI|nr:hypothetical protein KVT40_001376 [Elsinoe batatas]
MPSGTHLPLALFLALLLLLLHPLRSLAQQDPPAKPDPSAQGDMPAQGDLPTQTNTPSTVELVKCNPDGALGGPIPVPILMDLDGLCYVFGFHAVGMAAIRQRGPASCTVYPTDVCSGPATIEELKEGECTEPEGEEMKMVAVQCVPLEENSED